MSASTGSQIPKNQNIVEAAAPGQQRAPLANQPQVELPPMSTPVYDADASATPPKASDTLGGPTSADLHTGLGKPISGQTSAELHRDGQAHRKRQGGNVQQYGIQAGGMDNINARDNKDTSIRDLKDQDAA